MRTHVHLCMHIQMCMRVSCVFLCFYSRPFSWGQVILVSGGNLIYNRSCIVLNGKVDRVLTILKERRVLTVPFFRFSQPGRIATLRQFHFVIQHDQKTNRFLLDNVQHWLVIYEFHLFVFDPLAQIGLLLTFECVMVEVLLEWVRVRVRIRVRVRVWFGLWSFISDYH